jgi:hypothetical protein
MSLLLLAHHFGEVARLHTFQVADMSRMQRLMDCLLRELFPAHGGACLDQVCTSATDRVYCVKVSIDQLQLEKRPTVAR